MLKRKRLFIFRIKILSIFFVISLSAFSQDLEDNHVYKVVRQMPFFENCINIESNFLKFFCHESQMFSYIYTHEEFNSLKIEEEGIHVMSFIIEKDGSLSEIESVRNISDKYADAFNKVFNDISEDKMF